MAREFTHTDPDGNVLVFGSPDAPDDGAHGAAADPVPAAAPRLLAERDQVALSFMRAIKQGDVDRLTQLLAEDSGLATTLINSITPLHHFADAPGHRPNAAGVVTALVAAGADLNAHVQDAWHHETPLHWAASNDDVVLIDALIDAGAQYLLGQDAELDWETPWDGETPLDAAAGQHQHRVVAWLRGIGAASSRS